MKKKLPAHRRHDLSDELWVKIEPLLLGREGSWGGIARDNRRFIHAVLWIIRTGAPWRDLPPDYGGWSNTHRRFIRWRNKGIWQMLFEHFIHEPDMEWLMVDASHVKVHPHATGALGGSEATGRTKGGSTPKSTLPWMRTGSPCAYMSQPAPLPTAHKPLNSSKASKRKP